MYKYEYTFFGKSPLKIKKNERGENYEKRRYFSD